MIPIKRAAGIRPMANVSTVNLIGFSLGYLPSRTRIHIVLRKMIMTLSVERKTWVMKEVLLMPKMVREVESAVFLL